MKHFFITALLTTGTMTAAIASPGISAREAAQARIEQARHKAGTIHTEQRNMPSLQSQMFKAPRAKMVNVNFTMANPDDYSLKLAVAIDRVTGICEYYADQNSWDEATIPAGEYDFLFWGESEEEPYYYCMYGDENVVLSEDREYVLDFSKCTEMVKFESTLPDGSRARIPLENLDTGEIVEEGNIAIGIYTLYPFIGSTLIDFVYGYMDRGVYDDGWYFDGEEGGNVLVNEGLNSISLVQYRQLVGSEGNNGTYYASIAAIPARGGVYTNPAEEYALYNDPTVITSVMNEETWNYPGVYATTVYQDRKILSTTNFNTVYPWPKSDKYWIGNNEAIETLGLQIYPCPMVIGGEGYAFSSSSDSKLGILSNPLVNRNGEVISLATPTTFNDIESLDLYNSYKNWPEYGLSGGNLWVSDPWLDMTADRKKIDTGNSVPILVAEQCWYSAAVAQEYGIRSVLYHNYKGRNGEGRTIDFLGETVKISINGVEQDFSEFPSIHTLRLAPDERFGIWDIEFVNNNCYVNGEKGLNTTLIHFNDSGDDVCAPTLQMLQTLDADNNVTDRFNTPSEGRIILAGGDFTAMYDNYTAREWFDIQECDIKVECAVRGSEDWQEMECIENPDRFVMPGWGYYWEVPLESLAAPATDTAYDVRITLTDANGNYQQQTLTPVFTIAGTSGVTTINTAAEEGTYYNMQGIKIERPSENGIYIKRMNDGSSRKVMVKL